jgi:hypothetical protein
MAFTDLVGEMPVFPAPEDLILSLVKPLEAYIAHLRVDTWIPKNTRLPLVLLREEAHAFASDSFTPDSDPRFTRRYGFSVETFTEGINGDVAGARLQEIVYARLFTALRKQEVVEGVGYLTELTTLSPARRASDWATSTGVVQYANLPKGYHRYEASYGIGIRRDKAHPIDPLALFE